MTKPRLARLDEAESIMNFLRDQWSAQHVLATSRTLFGWQHEDAAQGRCNFIVAGEGADIQGVLGFIPLSRYDDALAGNDTNWLTTWKVRPKMASGLGVKLLWALEKACPSRWIGTIGLNKATRDIYAALGYATGRVPRYFLLNPAMSAFHLAQLPANLAAAPTSAEGTQAGRLSADRFGAATTGISQPANIAPRKSAAHFYNRYLKHPFYRYDVWLLQGGGASGLLAVRTCSHEGRTALRLVDFVGEPAVIAGARRALEEMLAVYEAEYLDFFCSGIEAEAAAAGLLDVGSVEGLVLPGYFEPYSAANVDLLYSLKGPGARHLVCKGDADQDRPNRLTAT